MLIMYYSFPVILEYCRILILSSPTTEQIRFHFILPVKSLHPICVIARFLKGISSNKFGFPDDFRRQLSHLDRHDMGPHLKHCPSLRLQNLMDSWAADEGALRMAMEQPKNCYFFTIVLDPGT